jgi:hypothetical protein
MSIATRFFLVSCLVAGGCSVFGMRHLPRGYRSDTTPDCSASIKPVVADAALAIVTAAAAVATLRSEPDEKAVGYLGGADALVLVGSGAWGLHGRAGCERARRAHDAWLRDRGLEGAP